MQRRDFLKTTATTSLGLSLLPGFVRPGLLAAPSDAFRQGNLGVATDDALAQGFLTPPASAKPYTFWQWMNGNITREGITLDLEAMQQMGLGGAYIFNNGVGIPRGPVDYASTVWLELVEHAAQEAQRLGLQLSLHNAPGYSGTGGPWITPENSMQQLVWTETLVHSTGRPRVAVVLPRPQAKHGYYRDAYVLAYPSLPVETSSMWEQVRRATLDGKALNVNVLQDIDTEKVIRMVPAAAAKTPAALLLEFVQPYEARAITLQRQPEAPLDPHDGPRDYPPVFRLEASDDGQTFRSVAEVRMPALRAMDVPGVAAFPAVKARYFRLSTGSPTYLSEVALHQAPRLPDWPAKTGYGEFAAEMVGREEWPAEQVIGPDKVVDVTRFLDQQGKLTWAAPPGRWTIVRIGHTTTGEVVAAAPESGIGLECDKYRKEALNTHFETLLVPIITRLKPYVGHSFVGLHTDSWEAGKQNWTRDFPADFQQRQGYDLRPYLLAMTGRVVESIDVTERFLTDVRRTFADLLAENYYGHFRTLCHAHGLQFSGEPYGDGNFDSLQVAGQLDTPLGEFWTRYTYGGIDYIRLAASAAHLYGSPVAGAEAYTGEPRTSKFTDYPYSLKAEGDWMMTMGINRFLLHVMVHQPHPSAQPGMTMGPFGTHFDRNSTWMRQMHGWTGYLTRAQYLLQQGRFVADLCYYKGDIINAKLPGNAILRPAVPLGYAADITGREALLSRFSVQNNRIALPDGLSYRLLVLPPAHALSVEVLRKVCDLVKAGAQVLVQEPPTTVPGLSAQRKAASEATTGEATLQALVQEIWGNLDGKAVTERPLGQGRIFRGVPLEKLLPKLGAQPDFDYTSPRNDTAVHYIHRQVGETDVYFIANRHRRVEELVCSFRAARQQPELWDAETGRVIAPAVFETEVGRTCLPIRLEPAGSVFVVFRKPAAPSVASLMREGKVVLSSKPYGAPVAAPHADVQDDFSISLWAKPDVMMLPGRGLLFYPAAGAVVYGAGHAACALAAGLNGVRLLERTDRLTEVLFAEQPLTGWTHLALVYRGGVPTVYLNGQVAGQGKKSSAIVHPGLHTPAALEQDMVFFEGDSTEPLLLREVLSEAQVLAQYQQGLPDELSLPTVELVQGTAGQRQMLQVWKPGTYELQPVAGGRARRVRVRHVPAPRPVTNPWQISFLGKGPGVPKPVVLPQLQSWHKQEDFNVRHFSGTAVYRTILELPTQALTVGQRLYLDLGRVAALAEVKLNGEELGQVWKPPFRVEITSAARAGQNAVEVRVTNLWPNRLIGDEHLPVEAEYEPWGAIKQLPAWYRNGQPKPGPRTAFSTWRVFAKTDPLLESGLLGPVRVLTAVERMI
ncbi:glycosyl hydrolase [Hymenobacter jejuensis]|uniref:Glycoside hydrolase n=1 Tax=Hymenobacter jejuensis TaxID=2502781 RepID=A0A5B8A5Y7_9BACT|nr:glycosyl hydrolase [Hymenobacter jejuensis]QDA61652.1 hypothetical protein FHG12_16790 [Hymenobacter jejuensis]